MNPLERERKGEKKRSKLAVVEVEVGGMRIKEAGTGGGRRRRKEVDGSRDQASQSSVEDKTIEGTNKLIY